MKFLIKYIWTLILLPPLFFIKGELSIQTIFEVNNIDPVNEIERKWQHALNQKDSRFILVPVRIITSKEGFNAEGFTIELYDSTYHFIQRSQIIQGYIRFNVVGQNAKAKSYMLVSPGTLDEYKYTPGEIPKPMLIHCDPDVK